MCGPSAPDVGGSPSKAAVQAPSCHPCLWADSQPIPTQKVQVFTMWKHPPLRQVPQRRSDSRAPGERGSPAHMSPCKLGSRGAWKPYTYIPVQTQLEGSVEDLHIHPRANSARGECGSPAHTSPCKWGSREAWKTCTYIPVQTQLKGSTPVSRQTP